ncbi:MAG: MFS transporter [Bacteroidales bacterium]|jgi:DHA3 family macrolide efflux protein-like MFS transporter|nr:MFS transporter [Bacteroidales bacterium]
MQENWQKKTAIFLGSQAISLFGSSLVQYAILWYITLETKSGTMMMISIVFGFVPTFFLAPFAGVWADRYNRKLLIALSDSMIALSTLLLAILFWLGHDYIWLLFLMSAVRAIGGGIQTPAVGAFLPQIVPKDKLFRINGINSSIQAVINLLSPMLAGAVLSIASIEAIFLIDVFTATIAVLSLIFLLKVPPHAKAMQKQTLSYFADLKAGLSYIKNHGYLKNFFIFCAFFFFLIAPGAFLTPLQVAKSYGDEVWRLTAIEVAFSIGMMLGGVLISLWKGFKNKIHTMAFATFIMGFSTFLLGLTPLFWIYLGIMFIYGIVIPIYHTPTTVLLQHQVEEEFHGRVFGVLSMIASSTVPMSMLLFGPLADLVKVEWILLTSGSLLLVLSFFFVRNKSLLYHG